MTRKRTTATDSDSGEYDAIRKGGRGAGKRSKASEERQPSSQYKGVCWSKTNRRWQAAIFVHSRNLYLGCYNEELEAAKAYDWVALKTRGCDAKINFAAEQYCDVDGNMLPNDRLHSLVLRHKQITEASRKAQVAQGDIPQAPRSHKAHQHELVAAEASTTVMAAAEASASIHPAALDIFTQQDVAAVYDKAASQLLHLAGDAADSIQGLPDLTSAGGAAAHPEPRDQQPRQLLSTRPTPWPHLTLAELHSRLLSEQLSQELTNRLFEQPQDAELLVSQLLQQTRNHQAPVQQGHAEQHQRQEERLPLQTQQAPRDVEAAVMLSAAEQQPVMLSAVMQNLLPARNVAHSPMQGGSSADCLHLTWRVASQPHSGAAAPAKAAGVQQRNAGVRFRASCWPHRHHIDMGQLSSRLPSGAFLQQVITGPFGMYGLVYGCPRDQTWGAGVWDGLEWHSVGSYECEADALRAATYVVDIGTSSCHSEESEYEAD